MILALYELREFYLAAQTKTAKREIADAFNRLKTEAMVSCEDTDLQEVRSIRLVEE